MKLKKIKPTKDYAAYMFYCPACEHHHAYYTKHPKGLVWSFNGDMDKPTFNPSLRNTGGEPGSPTVCHLFMVNGFIEYCSDSTHRMAGTRVALADEPPLKEDEQ